MKKNMLLKRSLSLVLAIAMLASLAACGKAPEETLQKPAEESQYSREDKELIGKLMGGQEDVEDLSDEELDALVEELTKELEEQESAGIVNLGNTQEEKLPTVDTTDNEGAYDENGAMTKPFDQVYPELIEKEEVTFSGESILVKLESDTLTDGLKAAGIGALEAIVPMEGAAWYEALLVEGTDAQTALAAVRELSEVLLAEYNYEIQTAALDDYKHFDKDKDEEFKKNGHNKDQWHFHHTGIVDGYEEMDKDGGDSSVVVAVIDSGVDYDHEDLIDNMWVNEGEKPDNGIDDDGNGYIDDYYGVDIVSRQGNGDDTNGHGTHVAGIIAARNNNTGVLGIAYNVKIMSVKAAMHNGTLNQADIARAVLYAYEMGAEVINMSFGGTACSIAVQDALATAYTRCVLVASAGNNGAYNEGLFAIPNYPAALTYVLGVMSVDETGRESAFTNWDVTAFNGVEYELYAPGESIMSTLPNNQYGFLSGTSMAAPIVSAMAAILRSEFSDRDKYPTKFIYGQLASTSEYTAECLDPELHGDHNLPQIVDLNAALTKMPKPEVNYQEYHLFDSQEFPDEDFEKLGIELKNNGDGVIDAGETIALGLTLRNRWGMSENTMVTIDTISAASGMSDPYITIHNPTVNYGSVGTYSTQDCGRIYTDEIITGWEHPFYITVSEDCPNDYRFTLNVTIRCENALDEKDETVYTTYGAVDENVRAGYILPSIIEEDMVLTPENLYIIPNSTVIEEGVTVRVEPGTNIQFWSDDANDPYASDYIAYLVVKGNFLVEGTKENPVMIYPSELMGNYIVDFGPAGSGFVSLKWADVTNYRPKTAGNISSADHCTFRQNYRYLYERYLSEGKVHNSDNYYTPSISNATNCVFYKLYTSTSTPIAGTYDRCIFNQCGLNYSTSTSYSKFRSCVFLGNSFVDQTNPEYISNSAMNVYAPILPDKAEVKNNDFNVFYRPETGTTYVRWYDHGSPARVYNYAEYLREAFGGDFVKIETEAEKAWLADTYRYNGSEFWVGARWSTELECYLWNDGTPIDLEIFPEVAEKLGSEDYCITFDRNLEKLEYDRTNNCLFEIPGEIKPTDITFQEYTVDMDVDTTYQIVPMNTPTQLPTTDFLYESADEAVLTVSDTGLVTPVANGTADVWVWSLDKAIRNRITFTVREYVPLESITFPTDSLKLEMGTSVYAPCVLTPADTTRHNVTYTSSDPSVVKVENGLLTAVGKGSAKITATCEGFTAVLKVSTWVRATHLTYETYRHDVTVESCDTALPKLKVTPANADLDLEWSSGNESILSVENGKLQLKKAGETYLRFTDKNSGLSDYVRYYVTSTAPVIQEDVIAVQAGAEPVKLPVVVLAGATKPVWKIMDPAVAQLKDGKIYFGAPGFTTLRVTDPRSGLTDEISIYVTKDKLPRIKELMSYTYDYSSSYNLAVGEDGSVYYWYAYGSNSTPGDAPALVCENAKVVGAPYSNKYTIITEDNVALPYSGSSVRDKGNNYTMQYLTLPEYIDPIGVAGHYYSYRYRDNEIQHEGAMWVLSADGKVYAIGYNDYGALGIGTTEKVTELTQVKLNEKVVKIAGNDQLMYYLTENGNLYISGGSTMQAATPIMVSRNVSWLDDNGSHYVANNRLYEFTGDKSEVYEYDLTGWTMLDMFDYYSGSSGIIAKDGKTYSLYAANPNCENPEGDFVLRGVTSAVDGSYINNGCYALTEEGMLFGCGNASNLMGMSRESQSYSGRGTFLPLFRPAQTLKVVETNLNGDILTEDTLKLYFNKQLLNEKITVSENGTTMIVDKTVDGEFVELSPAVGLANGNVYTVTISASGTQGVGYVTSPADITISFIYEAPEAPEVEETVPEETIPEETLPEIEPTEPVVYQAILDETVERYYTEESLVQKLDKFIEETQYNPSFAGNAILNPISTDFEVEHWLRPLAPTVNVGEKASIPFGGNYWGTTNEKAIGLQIIDYADFVTYARLHYAPYLETAPEDTFPFVTSVKLFNKDGEEVTVVGNEEVRFQVNFNRDMDTSVPLLVRFGSAYPYGDYQFEGKYVDARTWEGTYTLNTLIENGYQYFSISNGWSATDDLELQWDQYRFLFEIDTTAAQALIMQGNPMDTGIELKWTQDDFDTLMGYNVYRSDDLNGYYQRLNTTVIPADTMEWFDDTVEPGKIYYYNFTVVQTDMTESEPSGKISLMSKDTMAPNIYHSPVYMATLGQNLVITADVTDNLNIVYANLYYRVVGTDTWKTVRMNALNDKYSAILPAGELSLEGMEYYIEAFDGISFTYRGSETEPFAITIREAVDKNSLGDVDGDGAVTNRDALILLQAISHKYNMTADEFERADLNGDDLLSAVEALRILHYVTGKVGSLAM